MIQEFINFATELIPCINPYTKENVIKAIEQFKESEKVFFTTIERSLEGISQGDILKDVPFYKINYNGKFSVYKSDGLVLSNTCDCSRDENILIAPFIDINAVKVGKEALLKNRAYGYLHLPDTGTNERVVDFSLTNTFNRNLINNLLDNNKVFKVKSLNMYGYYLFICKLTIYLMRPEDEGVQEERLTATPN